MSDRIHSLTVVLEGVSMAVPHVADADFYIARKQAKADLRGAPVRCPSSEDEAMSARPAEYRAYMIVGLFTMIGCAYLLGGWKGSGIVVGWFLYQCGRSTATKWD